MVALKHRLHFNVARRKIKIVSVPNLELIGKINECPFSQKKPFYSFISFGGYYLICTYIQRPAVCC